MVCWHTRLCSKPCSRPRRSLTHSPPTSSVAPQNRTFDELWERDRLAKLGREEADASARAQMDAARTAVLDRQVRGACAAQRRGWEPGGLLSVKAHLLSVKAHLLSVKAHLETPED
eukprot:scaffold30241_cov89-Isochrysis_galbana.AAC.6